MVPPHRVFLKGLVNSHLMFRLVPLFALYTNSWTSLYMDGTALNFLKLIFPHEAGIWDPNYTPGVDFLYHDFL